MSTTDLVLKFFKAGGHLKFYDFFPSAPFRDQRDFKSYDKEYFDVFKMLLQVLFCLNIALQADLKGPERKKKLQKPLSLFISFLF